MQVIMLSSFKSVGKSGEVVNVKPGYAKNYLVPFGIAKYATKAELANIEANRAQVAQLDEKRSESSLSLKSSLETGYLVIVRAAGDDGRLYGSVRTTDVLALLNEKVKQSGVDIEIRRSDIDMGQGIKEIGIHICKVHLYGSTFAEVKLNIARSTADATAVEKAIAAGEEVGKAAASFSQVLKNVSMEPQSRKGGKRRLGRNEVVAEGVASEEDSKDDKVAHSATEAMEDQSAANQQPSQEEQEIQPEEAK